LGTPLPQQVEFECFEDVLGELDDNFAAASNDFARNVDELATYGRRVAGHRDDISQDILFEGLEQKEGDQHGVVVRLIWSESLERERFGTEVFEGTVREFFGATLVIRLDDPFGSDESVSFLGGEVLKHARVRSEIGQDDLLGADELHLDLRSILFAPRAGIEGPPKSGPFFHGETEFHKIPDLLFVVILAPGCSALTDVFFHGRIPLSGRDKAYIETVAQLVIRFVVESSVHLEQNRYVLTIVTTNQLDNVFDHMFGCASGHGVPLARAKHGVDDHPFPGELDRLEPLHLLVGRADSMPLFGVVVVHHHRIDANLDDIGLLYAQSP